jgi:hypothetical protein
MRRSEGKEKEGHEDRRGERGGLEEKKEEGRKSFTG